MASFSELASQPAQPASQPASERDSYSERWSEPGESRERMGSNVLGAQFPSIIFSTRESEETRCCVGAYGTRESEDKRRIKRTRVPKVRAVTYDR